MSKNVWMGRISEAQEAARALSHASDQMNEHIDEINSLLSGMKLGVALWVSGESQNTGNLGYCRHRDEWQLVYESDTGPVPLRSAPREFRIYAAGLMPGFISGLLAKVSEEKESVEEANRQLSELALTLRGE